MCSTEVLKVANRGIKEFAAKEKLEIVLSAPFPAFTQEFRSGKQGEAGGRGVWGEFRPPSPASSVRIFSNRHRVKSKIDNMYLSYLMGARQISDQDLISIGVEIGERTDPESRELKIPSENIEAYKSLIREKMAPGFWNEFLDENNIHFIFKRENGNIKEYVLSPENEQEIDNLCSVLNNEPPGKTANAYTYISENDFYHDFMVKHYKKMIER